MKLALLMTLGVSLLVAAAQGASAAYSSTNTGVETERAWVPTRQVAQGATAISANYLDRNISRTKTATSQSVTIGANRLALLWITEEEAGQTPAIITDPSRSWTAVTGFSDGLRRLGLYRSMSPTGTTSQFTVNSISPIGFAWTLVEYTNVDTSGTNGSGALAQVTARGWQEVTDTFAFSGSAILAPSSVGGGAVAAGFALHNRSKDGVTAGPGYTLTGPVVCVSVCAQAEFRNSFATLVDMSWGPLDSHWLVAAVELKPAGALTLPPSATSTPAPTATTAPAPTATPLPAPTATPLPGVPTATLAPSAPTATPLPGAPTATLAPSAPTAMPPAAATATPAPVAAGTSRPTATASPLPTAAPALRSATPTPEAAGPKDNGGCNGSAPELAWIGLLGGVLGMLAVRTRRRR